MNIASAIAFDTAEREYNDAWNAPSTSVSAMRGNERRMLIGQLASLPEDSGRHHRGRAEATCDQGLARADRGTARCQSSWFRGQRRGGAGRSRKTDPTRAG